jgi:hypothetical protein
VTAKAIRDEMHLASPQPHVFRYQARVREARCISSRMAFAVT